ncbi:overproduction-induced pheromone-resistant [Ceratocystis pirilliformis]|uniref:Overproduction-induced pheromone-resistant n=1 Tax=Ceratocystis pirilliformis TaxID=259994 RepID=A0ABR3YBI0_9PEZI
MSTLNDGEIVIETTSDVVFREALKARELYPRNDSESGCAVCQSGVTLRCEDSCYTTPGYQCVQVVSVSNCRECPMTKCQPTTGNSSASSSASSSSDGGHNGPNVGVIAGATIGGVILISTVAFMVWFFFIKKKRAEQRTSASYKEMSSEKSPAEQTTARNNRSSMHTVHSIASTVLTRASNIIQIAYIPGVTNRANPTSPTVLVPPVPPIPIQVTGTVNNTPRNFEDQHFFMPGDLRASTYSDMSGFSDRTSFARQSYAMRSSVASTVYGKNAIIVAAPQTGMRVKPAMVSVRPSHNGPGGAVPPVPTVDVDKYARPKSRAESTFSVGSTFVNSASAATVTPVKGQAIRVVSGKKNSSPLTTFEVPDTASTDSASTIGNNIPQTSPFLDPEEKPSVSARMSAVMEEETACASPMATIMESKSEEGSNKRNNMVKRGSSPFSDAFATKD